MSNYIRADIRRILRKRSFLNGVGIFAGLFAVLVFIYFNPAFTAEMYVSKITSFMSYFPLVIGLLVFLSVYADDFKCRSMQVAIGYGIPRGKIIMAKLLESALLLLGVAFTMTVLVLGTPMLLGLAPNAQQASSLALTMAAELLRAIGYGALSAIAVFFTQNAVNGTILYVLFSSKTIYIIATILLGQDFLTNTVGNLTKYLYTTLLYTAKADLIQNTQFDADLIVALLSYVVLPTAISVVGFRKKELEF